MTGAHLVSSRPASREDDERSTGDQTSGSDDGLTAFMGVRRRLFGIAHRILGNAAEAEDLVQDVWLRWQLADRGTVRSAPAFLVTTTTRLAINVVQSARSRLEHGADPWLSERIDTSADPERGAERDQGLAAGMRLLLEKLSPAERAAYILREAFDYTYRDIANSLGLGEANARQIVTRARQHVAGGRRAVVAPTDCRRLLELFRAAAHRGDVGSVEDALCRRWRDRNGRPGRAPAPAGRAGHAAA